MTTADLRRQFRHRLDRALGAERVSPFRDTGSHSMLSVDAGGTLLIRAGNLDRERRMYTKLRSEDFRALLRGKHSAICFRIRGVGDPVIVPATYLAKHLPPCTNPISLHLRVAPEGRILLAEGGLDLTRWRGWKHLERFRQRNGGPAPMPKLSHAQWQTIVAAMARSTGLDVYVPHEDRSSLDAGYGRWANLPSALVPLTASAAAVPTLHYADVVCTRPGSAYPSEVYEVEHGSDISAALARSAGSLATLTRHEASQIPDFVFVGDARRRTEFERKLNVPLFEEIGLCARASFLSYQSLYARYCAWKAREVRLRRKPRVADREVAVRRTPETVNRISPQQRAESSGRHTRDVVPP